MCDLEEYVRRVEGWLPDSEMVELHNGIAVVRTVEGDVLETKQTKHGLYHQFTIANDPCWLDLLAPTVTCDECLHLGDLSVEYDDGFLVVR
ncbi:hypothetical protein [Halorubrum laminariae]|uniref:Uncharacterized protein n=2 Tax=Haloferacaceae TaxID=1644056 RepID=A0ABD6BYH3_9EURY|nr:hypothetical protein [Halorubrum laminariae]